MKSSTHCLGRPAAVLLVLLLSYPLSDAGLAMAQQPVQRGSQNASSSSTDRFPLQEEQVSESALPDSPTPQAPNQGQQAAAQSTASQSQDNSHKPVGTAAAPYEPTVGIAASRPAGAAIAPAKQRRVRTFLISLGVIAGAGIAVGSVAALSHGSPSRP
jgi:hypothetical protein